MDDSTSTSVHPTLQSVFKLRVKPCQYVRGKTEETLNEILTRWEENRFVEEIEYADGNISDNNDDVTTHLLEIVVTNKSLLETEMWKYRTQTKFHGQTEVNVHILSSKSDDFTNVHTYINNISNARTRSDLPNILIICYHQKRVCTDLIQLCNTFGGLYHTVLLPNMKKKHTLKLHISFDEPDANLSVTHTFLKRVVPFVRNRFVTGILFITATPIQQFWDMLAKVGISQLLNVNKNISPDVFVHDYQFYRSFEDHSIDLHDNPTQNPLSYIMSLFCPRATNGSIFAPKIDERSRRIIFAPGHIYTSKTGVGSHDELENFFVLRNYTVLKLNGSFKGFIYPDSTQVSVTDYNLKHGIVGELRETLRHWSENNPTTHLAITGYLIVERGVTFNTINFNFTDMIISAYHLKSIAKLIQIVGRGSGGKQYVDQMTVHCPSDVFNAINTFNERLRSILSINPNLFNRTDFSLNENRIPVKGTFIDDTVFADIVELKLKHKSGYKSLIHQHLVMAYSNEQIKLDDKNNTRFNFANRRLNGVRMYTAGQKVESRRYKQFNEAHDRFGTPAQACEADEYNIDFVKDRYEYNGFINDPRTFWITYKVPLGENASSIKPYNTK